MILFQRLFATQFFIIFIFLMSSCNFDKESNITEPIADLSGVDLMKSHVLLNGEWEFYWNKFLNYGEFEKNNSSVTYINVPST